MSINDPKVVQRLKDGVSRNLGEIPASALGKKLNSDNFNVCSFSFGDLPDRRDHSGFNYLDLLNQDDEVDRQLYEKLAQFTVFFVLKKAPDMPLESFRVVREEYRGSFTAVTVALSAHEEDYELKRKQLLELEPYIMSIFVPNLSKDRDEVFPALQHEPMVLLQEESPHPSNSITTRRLYPNAPGNPLHDGEDLMIPILEKLNNTFFLAESRALRDGRDGWKWLHVNLRDPKEVSQDSVYKLPARRRIPVRRDGTRPTPEVYKEYRQFLEQVLDRVADSWWRHGEIAYRHIMIEFPNVIVNGVSNFGSMRSVLQEISEAFPQTFRNHGGFIKQIFAEVARDEQLADIIDLDEGSEFLKLLDPEYNTLLRNPFLRRQLVDILEVYSRLTIRRLLPLLTANFIANEPVFDIDMSNDDFHHSVNFRKGVIEAVHSDIFRDAVVANYADAGGRGEGVPSESRVMWRWRTIGSDDPALRNRKRNRSFVAVRSKTKKRRTSELEHIDTGEGNVEE